MLLLDTDPDPFRHRPIIFRIVKAYRAVPTQRTFNLF